MFPQKLPLNYFCLQKDYQWIRIHNNVIQFYKMEKWFYTVYFLWMVRRLTSFQKISPRPQVIPVTSFYSAEGLCNQCLDSAIFLYKDILWRYTSKWHFLKKCTKIQIRLTYRQRLWYEVSGINISLKNYNGN